MTMQSLLLYQKDHIAEQEGRGEIVGLLIFGVIPILAFRVITSTKRSSITVISLHHHHLLALKPHTKLNQLTRNGLIPHGVPLHRGCASALQT